MTTDTSEKGLERLICMALTGAPCDPGTTDAGSFHEPKASYGGNGRVGGSPDDYERE
jgi:type I restriction enzyme, R subunit